MTQIIKNTLRVLDKKEKKQFGIFILLDILINVADVLSLICLLWVVQYYIQPSDNKYANFLPAWVADRSSVWLITIFVLFFTIKNWLGYVITRSGLSFISKIAVRISRDNLAKYQNAKFSEFIQTDSSAHIRHASFQPFDFAQYMLSGMQQVITQSSLIAITILAIVVFNAKLFLLVSLILLPPSILIFSLVKKKLSLARKQIQVSNERSFQYLLDALKGYVEGNIYNRNDFFLNRFITTRGQFSKQLFNSIALQGMPTRIIEIFAVLGLFILIVISTWGTGSDEATLITIGAFMVAAYKIIPGIVKLINGIGQMKAYEFSMDSEKANRYEVNKLENQSNSHSGITSIEFKNVYFKYADQSILNNLSFELKPGDFFGITGASGKGKTTIMNLLLGFLHASKGEIIVNNIPSKEDQIKIYWPYISYVRQQAFLIHDSMLKNITLEESGYDELLLQEAIKVSGVEKMIEEFSEGLEKLVTENGKNISGGQQQRISIARALYKNASVILLDEPFNELDELSTKTMLEHFKRLAESGKIIIMITHDSQSLSYCNKVISLDA